MPLSWSRDPLFSKRKCSEGMLLMLELQEAFDELGWEAGAEYEICTAGCQTYEIDGHGTKWSPKKGTKKSRVGSAPAGKVSRWRRTW